MAATEGVPCAGAQLAHHSHADHFGWTQNGRFKNGDVKPNGLMDRYNGYAAHGSSHVAVTTKKRKEESVSLIGALCAWVVEHQIGLSVNLVLLLLLTHLCFPRARRRTRLFYTLSYQDPETGFYKPGEDDLAFVAFWVVVFTGVRAAIMDYILMPFARWRGIRKTKTLVRFAEQAWLLIYYCVFWTLGMYIMYTSPHWLSLEELWTQFPTRTMDGLFKWYYLVQFAFWLQQILVVNIEERRKDYAQMFSHHIITCALIFMSYGCYQMRVGNAILCIMDVVDIVLPAAKLLKYLGYQTACDVAFGIFILTWFIARHVLYLLICYSVYRDVPGLMPAGCYDTVSGLRLIPDHPELLPRSDYPPILHDHPNFHSKAPAFKDMDLVSGGTEILRNVLQPFTDPDGPVCFNNHMKWAFLSLLLALQVITLIWFGMIVKVAYKVLSGKGADDVRSDSEDGVEDEEEEDIEVQQQWRNEHRMHQSNGVVKEKVAIEMPKYKEEEVGVEELRFVRKTSPGSSRGRGRGVGGRASGISLPGHLSGDHKELLGRIGCDKPA